MGSVIDRLPTKKLRSTTGDSDLEDEFEDELEGEMESDSQMSKVHMLLMTAQAVYFYRKGRKIDSLLLLAAVFVAPRSGRAAYLVNTAVTLNTLRKYLKGEKK